MQRDANYEILQIIYWHAPILIQSDGSLLIPK